MWAYVRATLAEAILSPVTWGLLGFGAFMAWCGVSLAILSFVEMGRENQELIRTTGELFGVLIALGLVGRLADVDRISGFVEASDAARWGPGGRLTGRWAGAVLAGGVGSALICAASSMVASVPLDGFLYLQYTSMCTIALAAAWGAVVAARWNGVTGGLVGLLLWGLGHLPWGRAPFLEGVPGRIVRAWLPGGSVDAGSWLPAASVLLAAGGVLAMGMAVARPAEPRG